MAQQRHLMDEAHMTQSFLKAAAQTAGLSGHSWALRAGREDDAIFTGQIGGAQIRISRCLHSALKI